MSLQPSPRVRRSAASLQQADASRPHGAWWTACTALVLLWLAAEGGMAQGLMALAFAHPFLLLAGLWFAIVMRSIYASEQRAKVRSTRSVFRANPMHAPRNRRVA